MKSLPDMIPFYTRFPDVAERETRVVTLPRSMGGLPADNYAFIEMFCSDPQCDCRRVVILVWPDLSPGKTLATINFGWETVEFYTRWMRGDEQAGRKSASATLDPLNPQSRHSELLLALFCDVVSNDPAYVQRLARHYEMFKQIDKDQSRPLKNKLKKL
jgi:hypothetical protein